MMAKSRKVQTKCGRCRRLRALRGPGESLSDVILRLVEMGAARVKGIPVDAMTP